MADTCYLCSVGAKRLTPRATSTPGIGTCTDCSVHACLKHGDRDPDVFRCVDCITRNAVAHVVANDVPQRVISKHGAYLLFARSPGLALVGAPLFLLDHVQAMRHVLRSLHDSPHHAVRLAQRVLERRLDKATPDQVAYALGINGEEALALLEVDRAPNADEVLSRIGRVRIELTFDGLVRDFERWDRRLEFDEGHASYALAVLAVAFGARDGVSLNSSALDVGGGLYLPPLVLLLSTLLLHELRPSEH